MSLSAGFVQHASPEAIEARMREASAREHAAAAEVNALIALLRERVEQIAAGTWPAARVSRPEPAPSEPEREPNGVSSGQVESEPSEAQDRSGSLGAEGGPSVPDDVRADAEDIRSALNLMFDRIAPGYGRGYVAPHFKGGLDALDRLVALVGRLQDDRDALKAEREVDQREIADLVVEADVAVGRAEQLDEALREIDTPAVLPKTYLEQMEAGNARPAAEWWKHLASKRREVARRALAGEPPDEAGPA